MAINSSTRTLHKIAWLDKKEKMSNFSNLQLQKFLFFYEMFQYCDNKSYDFASLKAYRNGPVFSRFYGDQIYRESELREKIKTINTDSIEIDNSNALKSYYVIESLNDSELSELTHQLNFWNVHSSEIESGKKQIAMDEKNITADDIKLIHMIKNYVPMHEHKIIKIGNKRFSVRKEQFEKLSDEHLEVMDQLSRDDELLNPVFIEVDDRGRLIID